MGEHAYELLHYGVPGMRWGVIRSRQKVTDMRINRRQKKNESLEKKAAKYDVKAAKRSLKNIKRGQPEVGLIPTKKSAKLDLKAAKVDRKTVKMDSNSREYRAAKRKAAKLRLKSVKAMTISELSTKKDYKYQIESAAAKYKIETNKLKIDSLDKKSVELGRRLMDLEKTD